MNTSIETLLTLLGGGGIGAVLTFLNERSKARTYLMGAVDKAVSTAMTSLSGEVTRLNNEVKGLREIHKECERRLQVEEEARRGLQRQLERKIEALRKGDELDS